MMRGFYFTVFILSFVLRNIHCAKILGVFPIPSISHQRSFSAVGKALSLKGHEVTMITTNPLKDKSLTNLTEIDISKMYDLVAEQPFTETLSSKLSLKTLVFNLRGLFNELSDAILSTEAVKDLIKSDRHFDLVIAESHVVPLFAFGARFKAPLIVISTGTVFLDIHDFVGNPTHPVLAPDMFLQYCGSTETPFMQRLKSFNYNIWHRIVYQYILLPRMDRIVKKHFGDNLPYLGDIASQISLVMLTTNPFMDTVRPNLPNIINLEQLHLQEPKPLPKDLKNFVDSSPNGTVYFSLGTNVFTYKLDKTKLHAIFEALGSLPYNVIMKFEKENFPEKPANILIRKWIPQQDLLGHPNIKVFVTQGGVQSIEEAINTAVPMVGVPLGIDQVKNVNKITEMGIAVELDYSTINADVLRESILKVATDPSFKRNVMKCKTLLEDQPLKRVDKAVWWIEYVLRHNGAKHLRYPGAELPFYKYFMLDVILFILVIFLLLFYVLMKILYLLHSVLIETKLKRD